MCLRCELVSSFGHAAYWSIEADGYRSADACTCGRRVAFVGTATVDSVPARSDETYQRELNAMAIGRVVAALVGDDGT